MQRSPEVNHYGLSIVENGDENPTRRLYAVGKCKTRLLVQKGLEYVLLRLKDIVLFYTENKVTYVVDNFEKKYISPYNLTELERELDNSSFFRANRQYIVNMDFIRSFRAHEKVKIRVDMNLQSLHHEVIISQETAPAFRMWMHQA